jgi:thioredoxin-related protein
MIDKLFEENIEIKSEVPIDTIDISTNFILAVSMEKCPYCELLHKDYLSKTDKRYSIITYKSGEQLSFDNNFLDIPPKDRENIIIELNKLLQGEFVFPTIIHNKKIIRGLQRDSLDKIFT